MARIAKIATFIIALLVVSGMVLHEVIPHHHHSITGEVHTCCDSHNHGKNQNQSDSPCNLLTNIHFENFKPSFQVYQQQLKHFIPHNFIAICSGCNLSSQIQIPQKTAIFIPEVVLKVTAFKTSYSHRGPPTLLS